MAPIDSTCPRRFAHPLLASMLLLAAFAGCDNSFTPKQDYKERIVVFCVLDPSQPYQSVRLESTYDAAGTNPKDPIGKRDILEAIVRVSSDRKSILFTDTLVDDGQGGRKKIWISRELLPAEGRTYALTVDVPGKDRVTASLQVPSRPYLDLVPPNLATGKLGVELAAGAISTVAPPKGFYFRFWLVGQVWVNGRWMEVRHEVPRYIDPLTGDSVYTKPGRESSVSFSFVMISGIKARMEDLEGVTDIQILGVGYSLDNFIYSYFQTVRGFDDRVSVRQDRPDVTNINGGVGIFGAVVPDSLRVSYVSIIVTR